jgi:hypothetical protein
MKTVVARVMGATPFPVSLDEIDISTVADLESRYGSEIPVLLVDGRKAAKYRVTDEDLLRILAGRANEPATS